MERRTHGDFTCAGWALVGVDTAARSRSWRKFTDVDSSDVHTGVLRARVQVPTVRVRLAAVADDIVRTARIFAAVFGAVVTVVAIRGAVAASGSSNVGTCSRRFIARVGRTKVVVVTIVVDKAAVRLHAEITLSKGYVARSRDAGAWCVAIRVTFAAAQDGFVYTEG